MHSSSQHFSIEKTAALWDNHLHNVWSKTASRIQEREKILKPMDL